MGSVAKRVPHVHHDQSDPRGFSGSEPREELSQAGLGAVRAPEPDRAPANEVADDNPIRVPFPDRHLVDADDLRAGRAGAAQLLAHVLLLEFLDGVPLQMQLLRDVQNGRRATAPPHIERKSLRVARVVGKEVELLAFHRAATPARDAARLELQEDPHPSTREVPNPAQCSIADAAVNASAHPTDRVFERRTSLTIRRPESPTIPTTVCRGRKPGKRYESERRRRALGDRSLQSCQMFGCVQPRSHPLPERV